MALQDYIDIVDGKDNVIGSATILTTRKKGLIHRIARVMVEDEKGNLLLQKRTNKLTWPHCWDNSAAGHVDKGEDYITAAKRELFEEIGVEGSTLTPVGKYFTDVDSEWGKLKRFNQLYKTQIDFTPSKLQKDEVAEVRWFTLKEAKELIQNHRDKVTDGLVDVLNRYY